MCSLSQALQAHLYSFCSVSGASGVFCMAVFSFAAALVQQFLLALLLQFSVLESHRSPEACLLPSRHWANLLDKLCFCLTSTAPWLSSSCKQFYTSAVGTSMAKRTSYEPCNHWNTKSVRQECSNLLVSTPGRGFTGIRQSPKLLDIVSVTNRFHIRAHAESQTPFCVESHYINLNRQSIGKQ